MRHVSDIVPPWKRLWILSPAEKEVLLRERGGRCDEKLFERAKALEPKWCDAVMTLKGLPNVLDIRCVGLTGGIDLAPIPGSVGLRGYRLLEHSFHEEGVMLRLSGDTIELMPPLIISEAQIGEIMDKVAASIKAVA